MPMISREAKARALARVLRIISEGPITAKRLAKRCNTTKPTIYSRLAELRESGFVIDETKVRDGLTGPLACAYSLRIVPPKDEEGAKAPATAARARVREQRQQASA